MLLSSLASDSEPAGNAISIIPLPVKLKRQVGTFRLNKAAKLIFSSENKEIAELFAAMLLPAALCYFWE